MSKPSPDLKANFPDKPLEEGNRIWATRLFPRAEQIHATATVSQQLIQGFRQNSQPAEHERHIPTHHDFHSVFSKNSFDELPGTKPWDHAIELTPNASPKSCKVYLLSASKQKELDAFLKENFKSGRIRPSKSPMATLVFFVKKKDRKLHLVQDFCALNAMTMINNYPLPLILELIAKLHRAKYFTKLDVQWGFNNVWIKEGDKWKAVVMFFGLTNSPTTFQTMMGNIFEDLILEGIVVVYLDDILIFMETLEEHRKIIRHVLELLEKHKLYLHSDKCKFEKTTIEYLGVWPAPTNKKEVQSFLGFTNFYRWFI